MKKNISAGCSTIGFKDQKPFGQESELIYPDGFFYGLEKQLKSIHRQLQGKLWNNYYWNRENHRMKSKKELFERMEAVENRLDRIEEELSKLTK